MKKSSMKGIALCLCALLSASGIAMTAFALNTDSNEAEKQEEPKASFVADNAGISKDETVYVLAGTDGSVQKIIVSDWIKNSLGSAAVNDNSELTNVENVKGEETYTMNGDNMRVWDAQGNDIYYQGNIEKELPVDLSVTYKLDGKPILANDLVGKSGRVTIRFDYQNKQYETVEIDGKQEKIYVPFAMLTGVLLDDDVFTNVEVTNGRLINDGSRTAVIGIAFPGLQENLAISKDKLEIPNYVEITADASNFQLAMTVTLATNEIFNELDGNGFDSVSELRASVEELMDAMNQLTDGVVNLKNGANSLDAGAAELMSGAAELSEGLNTLASNNDTLNAGAKQVFETLLSTANTQLAAAGLNVPALTVENYAQVLSGIITSLDKNAVYQQALSQVTAAVEAQSGMIEQQVTAAVLEEVTSQVTAAVREEVAAQVTQAIRNTVAEQVIQSVLHMDKSSYDAAASAGQIEKEMQEKIEAAIGQQMQSQLISAQIQAETDKQMATQTIQDTVAAKTGDQMQSDAIKQTITEQTELQIQKIVSEQMASDEVQAQLTAAAEGAKSVVALKSSLDSYNAFYLGLQSYTAGVADAAAGAGTLKAGTDVLKAGTSQLSAGASELYDGLIEFNEKGIKKLADGNLDGLVARFRATKNVSLRYKNFAGASEDMDGQVKFIYRTDSIE